MTSSVTGGEGPGGGHEMRKARNLLESSVLYMDEDRFGRSIKLHLGENTSSILGYQHDRNKITQPAKPTSKKL